ncbi:MAG: PilN domain-containing protein [Thiomargarita sp.]|nr:PilN domain-containing protein [Thiomargarita sp.]
MAHINLLPWRDTLKKEREIRLSIITGISLSLVGIVVFLVHLYMSNEIEYQQERNQYLQAEITKADSKIKEITNLKNKKERLISRMNVIQDLEKSRSNIVHLFDELVKQVPGGVYFTSMKQRGKNVTLIGVAQSEARVSSLMISLEASPWIGAPKIDFIKTTKQSSGTVRRSTSRFQLRFTQTVPKE